MLNSAAFIVGFSIVFITLGAISTEVGQVLVQYKSCSPGSRASSSSVRHSPHGLFRSNGSGDTRLHNLKGSNSRGSFVIDLPSLRMDTLRRPDSRRGSGFAADQDKVWKGIFLLPFILPIGRSVPADFAGIERF